jgi:hypothetical protein
MKALNMFQLLSVVVPALENEGPDCDPCGGPLKVIVQGYKMTNLLVYELKFG